MLAACPASEPDPGTVRPAPGRFLAVGEVSVLDSRTGLEWTRRDAGRPRDWTAAHRLCNGLETAGSRDWRLPEIEELRTLYDERSESSCGADTCRVDHAFDLGGPFLWSATASGPKRRFYIDLRFGSKLAPLIRPALTRRVMCVRTSPERLDSRDEADR